MASSSKETGQHWWIGWYALAFVPDELQEEDEEKLDPGMTKLTENGDIIYNIFQGDMNGDGYQTTKASSKFKSVNYDSNIKKNYRYVLDGNGRNNLVTWVGDKNGLKGACVYKGVEVTASQTENAFETSNSEIPLPAPLLYTGYKAAGEGWNTTGMGTFLGSGSEGVENFYPVEKVGGLTVPRVSTDFRNYEGYKAGLDNIEHGDAADYANGLPLSEDLDGWFPSVYTYTQNEQTDMDEDYNKLCLQYWKVLSISNFNKYCAPVNASGLLYDENTGCRNMAKATKYFPISDYSVTSTTKTADNEYATGIRLKVDLKLNGNAEDGVYFKDGDGDVTAMNPLATEEELALFNTKQVSFKFNRIGIYAVPMRQYGCSDDSGDMAAQYQIDTEAEPVLFAVCEWDSPVTLSDTGDGLSEFQSDIFIDLSVAEEDSAVIRESAVFYNLYEDDALDWYKNQLVANAAMGEAIINMQIEMGYLRNQKNAKQGCCPKSEEIKNTGKSSTGLRNLVDAKDYESNSVRNRLAQEEGKSFDDVYSNIIPYYDCLGSPAPTGGARTLYARKFSVVDESTQESVDAYTAFLGETLYLHAHPVTESDAVIDGRTYFNLVRSDYSTRDMNAVRFGNLWLSSNLYYELGSFNDQTNKTSYGIYNYTGPESEVFDSLEKTVDDAFGESGARLVYDDSYITVKKREVNGETVITWDDETVTPPQRNQQGYPSALNDIPSLLAELPRPIQPYEKEITYKVYFDEDTSTTPATRTYNPNYLCRRRTKFALPKVLLYKLDTDVFSRINQCLLTTGWRIPTRSEWLTIISKSTKEKIDGIRSKSRWGINGGTGNVYPLGGATNSHAGINPYTPWDEDESSKGRFIYLAIADTADEVVVFDGESFEIISKPSTGQGTGLAYVGVVCVSDAQKISDGKPKYKLGYDSYALMEGSICEGEHSFNASRDSIICELSNYNAILGGRDNIAKDASYNTILSGRNNALIGAVYCTVLGDNNTVGRRSDLGNDACRMLVNARDSRIYGGATSAIFSEFSTVETAHQSLFMGYGADIHNLYCSKFIGQSCSNKRDIYCSDVTAFYVYNLPTLHMSRLVAYTDTLADGLPTPLEYSDAFITHSDVNTYRMLFCRKENDDNAYTSMHFCRLTGIHASIINVTATHSDITLCGHYNNSWCPHKTLHSLNISNSSLRLNSSSIVTNYIDDAQYKSNIVFSDISLGASLMKMQGSDSYDVSSRFEFGIAKLAYSQIDLCKCSYLYENGAEHYLSSSTVKYATLVGKLMTVSGMTLQNTHIYGSLTIAGSELNNHLILGGLDGTTVGHNNSATSYISRYASVIKANNKEYPMIWSMGGIGMYMNKMVLGNEGVDGGRAPAINDVLTVVGTEDNVATVAWKPGGSGNSANLIIIQDDGVIIPYRNNNQYATISGEDVTDNPTCVRYSVLQDGEFTVYKKRDDVVVYDHPAGGSSVPLGLRPNGSNKIIWNTWYKILAQGNFDGDAEGTAPYIKEIENPEKGLYIVTDNLVEGVVYEVTINIRANCKVNTTEAIMNVDGTAYGGLLAPDIHDRSFYIYFYNNNGASVTANRWADSTHSSNHYIRPTFNRVPTENKQVAWGPTAGDSIQAPVLATATAYFVKIDGKVYVMGY